MNELEQLKKEFDEKQNQLKIEFEKRLKELELKASEEIYKDGLLQPKDGKEYFQYWNIARPTGKNDSWSKDHNNTIKNGFVFTTQEKAEIHQNKLIAFGRCLSRMDYLNGDWVPDWNDDNIEKYFLGFEKYKFIGIEFCHVVNSSFMFIFESDIKTQQFYDWSIEDLKILGFIK